MEECEFGQPVPVEFGDIFFHLVFAQLDNALHFFGFRLERLWFRFASLTTSRLGIVLKSHRIRLSSNKIRWTKPIDASRYVAETQTANHKHRKSFFIDGALKDLYRNSGKSFCFFRDLL
jgi:hypothetical protein